MAGGGDEYFWRFGFYSRREQIDVYPKYLELLAICCVDILDVKSEEMGSVYASTECFLTVDDGGDPGIGCDVRYVDVPYEFRLSI